MSSLPGVQRATPSVHLNIQIPYNNIIIRPNGASFLKRFRLPGEGSIHKRGPLRGWGPLVSCVRCLLVSSRKRMHAAICFVCFFFLTLLQVSLSAFAFLFSEIVQYSLSAAKRGYRLEDRSDTRQQQHAAAACSSSSSSNCIFLQVFACVCYVVSLIVFCCLYLCV